MQSAGPSTPKGAVSPVILTRTRKIPASVLTRADLLELYDQLTEKVREERDKEISQLLRSANNGDETKAMLERKADEVYTIGITITATNGESIFGDSKDVISNISSTLDLSSIYFDNSTAFQAEYGTPFRNRFALFLDFSKPSVFDFSHPVTDPTPNGSAFDVSGNDTWVRAVYDQFNSFFESRKTKRNRVYPLSAVIDDSVKHG